MNTMLRKVQKDDTRPKIYVTFLNLEHNYRKINKLDKKIKSKKGRILLALITCLIMLASVIYITSYSSKSMTNAERIVLGILVIPWFLTLTYSFIRAIPRKFAIAISDEYLIDNSPFGVLGKIKWSEISKVRRKQKKSIEVFFKEPVFKRKGLNFFQKFLLFMHNWNYKKSIIISSALLDCSVEELYRMVYNAHRRFKRKRK